jgi:hypothetical protein
MITSVGAEVRARQSNSRPALNARLTGVVRGLFGYAPDGWNRVKLDGIRCHAVLSQFDVVKSHAGDFNELGVPFLRIENVKRKVNPCMSGQAGIHGCFEAASACVRLFMACEREAVDRRRGG